MSDQESKIAIESMDDAKASKRGRLSELNLLGIVLREEIKEYPEYDKELRALKRKLDSLKWAILADYDAVKGYSTQKDFAFSVLHLDHAPALFALRKGVHIDDYFARCNIPFAMSLLKKVI